MFSAKNKTQKITQDGTHLKNTNTTKIKPMEFIIQLENKTTSYDFFCCLNFQVCHILK